MNKIISNGGIFNKYSAHARFLLFFCICIWFRFLLAFIIYKLSKNKPAILIILIISLFSILRNFFTNSVVWWCRSCHGIISIIIAITSLLSLLNYIDGKYISYIFLLDIIFGIVYTINKKPFLNEY